MRHRSFIEPPDLYPTHYNHNLLPGTCLLGAFYGVENLIKDMNNGAEYKASPVVPT